MRQRLGSALLALVVAATGSPASAQAPVVPRMPDGKPNLQGIWQVLNIAAWVPWKTC
jgi:hypothetical protein